MYVFAMISNKTAYAPAKTETNLRLRAVWSDFKEHSVGNRVSKASANGQHKLWSACIETRINLSLS